jgi:hypothetical protein
MSRIVVTSDITILLKAFATEASTPIKSNSIEDSDKDIICKSRVDLKFDKFHSFDSFG